MFVRFNGFSHVLAYFFLIAFALGHFISLSDHLGQTRFHDHGHEPVAHHSDSGHRHTHDHTHGHPEPEPQEGKQPGHDSCPVHEHVASCHVLVAVDASPIHFTSLFRPQVYRVGDVQSPQDEWPQSIDYPPQRA